MVLAKIVFFLVIKLWFAKIYTAKRARGNYPVGILRCKMGRG